MNLRQQTQNFARKEPLIAAWILLFVAAEVTALLAIQILQVLGVVG